MVKRLAKRTLQRCGLRLPFSDVICAEHVKSICIGPEGRAKVTVQEKLVFLAVPEAGDLHDYGLYEHEYSWFPAGSQLQPAVLIEAGGGRPGIADNGQRIEWRIAEPKIGTKYVCVAFHQDGMLAWNDTLQKNSLAGRVRRLVGRLAPG